MEKNHNTSWSRSKHLTIALLTLTLLTSGISLLLALLPPTWVFSTLGSRICPGARFQFEPSKGDLTPSLNTDRNTDRPLVALTLDDGPDPNPDLSTNATAQVLDLLAQHQVQATFFVIGENLKTPIGQTLAQRMVAEGHELGNHMMVDQKSVELAPAAFEQQLQQADQILKTFATPNWFRPGGGWCNQAQGKVVKASGYQLALGSIWPFDTHITSAPFARWYILHHVQPGAIIVLHDAGPGTRGERTVATLERVLPELKRRGYAVVSLSTALSQEY
jgi:peptidoglycan/xylan/chitin deacetylase (PgdA/CDA1 family)